METMYRRLAVLTAALGLLITVVPARADVVQFPLTVNYDVLRAAIRAHLHDQPGGRLELWRTADGCGSFVLREATVEWAGMRVKVAGPASGEAGLSFFGLCWATVTWTGYAEVTARPEIGADWHLHLRDPEIELYDTAHRKARGLARLFGVVKGWAEAELSTFTYDLGPPVNELLTLLKGFSAGTAATPLAVALQTMRPVGFAVEPDALKVVVALDVPAGRAIPPGPEPALTPAQIKRWEAKLDDWDGFLSFVVTDLAGENADPAVRDDLLALLLDTRRQVVAILAQGPQPHT